MSPDGRWCRSSGCDGTDLHLGGGLGKGREGVYWVRTGRDRTGHCWMFCLFWKSGVRCLRMDMGVNVSMSMAAYRLGRLDIISGVLVFGFEALASIWHVLGIWNMMGITSFTS